VERARITLRDVEQPRTDVRWRIVGAVAAHEHRTAAALLALLIFAYLHAVLIGGHVLLPTAGLYYDPPWTILAPPDLAHYVNRELEDVSVAYYPWAVLARRLLHAGTFPAWNPHALGGTPLFANFQIAWLSPFSMPLWILPLSWALGFVAAVKLWFAGFGTYLLARELRLGFWPAMLAAVSFALCAFNTAFLSYGVLVSVSAMLPWLLWLTERIVRRCRPVDGLALSAVVAVVIASGHPGTQLHVLAATTLFALLRTATCREVTRRDRMRRLGIVGGATALGVLMMAIVLIPAQMAAQDTVGAFARRQGSTEFPGAHMSANILRTALFPDWWGRRSEDIFAGPALYHERTLYAGVVALLLASVAVVSRGRWRAKLPFAIMGLVGVGVAVNAPIVHDVVTSLPLFDRVQNQRLLLWTQLAIAVLGAFGLQAVIERWQRRQPAAIAVVIAVALLVPLSTLHVEGEERTLALHYLLHRAGNVTEAGLALVSVAWWAIFSMGVAVLLLAIWLRPRTMQVALAAIVLVAALDMLHFASGNQPMPPSATAVPAPTPAIAYLQRHDREHRIAALGDVLYPDFTTVYGLRDVRGYDQPQPSLSFFRLWRAAQPNQTLGGLFLVRDLSLPTLQVTGAMGMRYLLFPPDTGVKRGNGLTKVYRGADAVVYRNRFAAPRSFVPSKVITASNEDDAAARVVEEGFDPRTTVVVVQRRRSHATVAAGRGEVDIVSEENARVVLHASMDRAGLVVLDDTWAPGWTVTVDGRPAQAVQPDVVLRAAAVPRGDHTIVWSFRVPGLLIGALLSAFGLAIFLGWGGWLLRRR
jgi:hypothetical protein